MKTRLPELLRIKGVLYSYTDYPAGSIERAKALFADMWDKSQLTETVVSSWDEAKARILKEKAWERLGYHDPETVLREIFGERYDLVELGKVHIGKDGTIAEAEEAGRKELGRHGGDRTKADGEQVDVIKLPPPSGKGGTGKEYLTARLHRDHPAIAAQVEAGTISARAGAIQAGIVRQLSPLEKAQAAFRRLVKEDRDAFDLWRAEQPL